MDNKKEIFGILEKMKQAANGNPIKLLKIKKLEIITKSAFETVDAINDSDFEKALEIGNKTADDIRHLKPDFPSGGIVSPNFNNPLSIYGGEYIIPKKK